MLSNLNFSLTQLEYVLAVHKMGHFAKAAELCNVTQPTLSMQLQKLEENLGVVLFDRSKKPILLTDAGARLIDQIQLILFESKKIESLIKSTQGGNITGELTVGVIPTVAPYILPRLLPVLEKQHPDLELKILELQTHKIIEALDSDEIDVGLLATPLKLPRIIEYPLFFEPFHVLCRKDHELAQYKRIKYSTLKFNDIWLLEEGHCLRNQVLDVCSIKKDAGVKRKYKFESGNLETIKNLINSYGGYTLPAYALDWRRLEKASSAGFSRGLFELFRDDASQVHKQDTLIPSLASDDSGGKTTTVSFERPIPAREIGLVYRREHYKIPLIEALGESILESIPTELRKIRQKDLDILPVE